MGRKAITDFSRAIEEVRRDLSRVQEQFEKRIVGNTDILRSILKALFSNGHILLEGAPGLGKTLMVRTMAEILDLDFKRTQFTPDLMPADIIGTNIIIEDERGNRHFRFEKGPVFTQVLLADEINRASPKTQSALLQAMEEHEATVFGTTYSMDDIFITLATQNPIEMAGTYPLPEAQLDRFFFKVVISYPSEESLKEIARRNATEFGDQLHVEKVLSQERILQIRQMLFQLPITDRIYDFAVQLVRMTHPDVKGTTDTIKRLVRYGASPRGVNALLAASRLSAVIDGRVNISLEDLEENFIPALCHRLVMRFEGEVEGVGAETLLKELFGKLKANF
ncbi:MAG: MoxR family ATPase [bacterium]|nr:MoxR family ATPase [bacterium]MDT8366662.1 MoxR family ATPase [bacterium]